MASGGQIVIRTDQQKAAGPPDTWGHKMGLLWLQDERSSARWWQKSPVMDSFPTHLWQQELHC